MEADQAVGFLLVSDSAEALELHQPGLSVPAGTAQQPGSPVSSSAPNRLRCALIYCRLFPHSSHSVPLSVQPQIRHAGEFRKSSCPPPAPNGEAGSVLAERGR